MKEGVIIPEWWLRWILFLVLLMCLILWEDTGRLLKRACFGTDRFEALCLDSHKGQLENGFTSIPITQTLIRLSVGTEL